MASDISMEDLLAPVGPSKMPSSQAEAAKQSGGGISFDEILTPAGRGEDVLTDIAPGGRFRPSGRDIAALGTSADINAVARYLAPKIFPNMSPDKAMQQFGTREGRLFYREPGTNKGYFVNPDLLGRIAEDIPKAIPAAAQAAAGIATAPLHLAGPGGTAAAVGATALAGGAAEALRQGAGDVLTGDVPYRYDVPKLGIEAAFGLIPELPAAGHLGMARSKAVRDIAEMNVPAAQRREQRAAGEGIPLLPAESTQLRSLGGMQKILGNHPVSANIMQDFFQRRDLGIQDMMARYVENLRAGTGAEESSRIMKGHSEELIKAQKMARARAARPLYEQAFAEAGPQDVQSIANYLGYQAEVAKGTPVGNKLMNLYEQLFEEVGGRKVLKQDLEQLDAVLKSFAATLDPSSSKYPGKQIAGQMYPAKKALQDILEENNPVYRQARTVWKEESQDMERFISGPIDALSRLKDANIASKAYVLFDPTNASPAEVKRSMDAVRKADWPAADAFAGNYIDRRMARALRETETGEVLNPAGKIRKSLFGTRADRDTLKAMLRPDQYKTLETLGEILADVSSVRMSGSDTAFNQEGIKALRRISGSLPGRTARRFMAGISPDIMPQIAEWWNERAFEDTMENMARIVTEGGASARQALSVLRSPNANQAQQVVALWFLVTSPVRAVTLNVDTESLE